MVNQAAVAERWPLVGRRPELSAFSHVLEDQGCDAFVVYGPRGVGKTRLAEECLQVAERAGRACGRAIASAEATAVPLAAIAHLLPADRGSKEIRAGETLDPVQLFARAKNAFEDRARGTRFVLMVDDLNLLDLTSATLLRQLLVTGTVLLLGTVLADPSSPRVVAPLWRDDRCHRVDLDQLSRESVETLLYHTRLGRRSTVRASTLCGRRVEEMCWSFGSWCLEPGSPERSWTKTGSGAWLESSPERLD